MPGLMNNIQNQMNKPMMKKQKLQLVIKQLLVLCKHQIFHKITTESMPGLMSSTQNKMSRLMMKKQKLQQVIKLHLVLCR